MAGKQDDCRRSRRRCSCSPCASALCQITSARSARGSKARRAGGTDTGCAIAVTRPADAFSGRHQSPAAKVRPPSCAFAAPRLTETSNEGARLIAHASELRGALRKAVSSMRRRLSSYRDVAARYMAYNARGAAVPTRYNATGRPPRYNAPAVGADPAQKLGAGGWPSCQSPLPTRSLGAVPPCRGCAKLVRSLSACTPSF